MFLLERKKIFVLFLILFLNEYYKKVFVFFFWEYGLILNYFEDVKKYNYNIFIL